MTVPRACCGKGCSNTERTIANARNRGMRRYDLLVHGVRPEGGGWQPFPSLESFKRHMQAIEDAERTGEIKVVSYREIAGMAGGEK
jgi:hypothetical protein